MALKFHYSAWGYGELAFQHAPTPQPWKVLFYILAKALREALITTGYYGWEKCGRTDRRASAVGQAISLWLREVHWTSKPWVLNILGRPLPAPDDSSPAPVPELPQGNEASLLAI